MSKPSEFGRLTWSVLEGVSTFVDDMVSDSDDEKFLYRLKCLHHRLLCLLSFAIKCQYCSISMRNYFDELDDERKAIFERKQGITAKGFLFLLHNKVNKKLGKKIVTFKEIEHRFEARSMTRLFWEDLKKLILVYPALPSTKDFILAIFDLLLENRNKDNVNKYLIKCRQQFEKRFKFSKADNEVSQPERAIDIILALYIID